MVEKDLLVRRKARIVTAYIGLNITIGDLIKWFQAIQKEKILTEKQLKEIWTPVKLNNGKDSYFRLGWESYKLQDGYRTTGHGGAGISSFMYYWNEQTNEKVIVIVLTNGSLNWTISSNQMNVQIASMILDDE